MLGHNIKSLQDSDSLCTGQIAYENKQNPPIGSFGSFNVIKILILPPFYFDPNLQLNPILIFLKEVLLSIS